MTASATVLIVASLNVDHIVHAPRIPSPGETILGSSVSRELGGKGGNQAMAAAHLGVPTAVVGCVGTDDDGDDYLRALTENGIDTTHISRTSARATGRAAITVGDDGANSIVVVSGANEEITEETAAEAMASLSGVRIVIGQMEASVDATAAAFRIARDRGVATLLNTAPATDSVGKLLPLSDIVVANEIEFQQITGEDSSDESALRRGAQMLFDTGVRWVVVTTGEEGSALLDSENLIRISAEVVDAVDTTAAGDAFVGAVAAHLSGVNGPLSIQDLEQACRLASRVAAVVVTRHGAHPSLPTLEDVNARF